MPSLSVVQHAEKYKEFYQQLYKRKGKARIALVAVQRKMLILIYSLWKKEEAYQADYGQMVLTSKA